MPSISFRVRKEDLKEVLEIFIDSYDIATVTDLYEVEITLTRKEIVIQNL